ncbi:hypothetical protein P3X46_015797 [Hevea brasiliensis]|uniref:Poly A polymerase head domain-containing protein n=1 Tax=Hevea brasiliensis TaxID=3981 RepID=A0ABQ9LZH6_HEVBR|nr:uncharacterized protein LOC110638725 isoform X2 [Hevea brasiliensis]KAJ9172580.1 hypothetical protein P3X46_015797 [Hevea brasiliensis]
MAIFLRAKNCLLCTLKSLTNSQRFSHTLTEQARLSRGMGYSDSRAQQSSTIDMSGWKKINAKRVGVTHSMIPAHLWIVLKILQGKGFQAYLVGGCVRDLLLNRIPKDFDVVTTAKLKEVKKQFFRSVIVGRRFPICRVHIRSSVVEVSSFETVAKHAEEKEKVLLSQMPSGSDKKDFVCWRNSMHRDFTINSLFFDPFKNQICDYVNGLADLKSLKLRTIFPAHLSFQEDCARILRGLRIAGRLGLSISEDTEIAMRKLSSSVKSLDKSKIMMELNYMLSYGAAESTICLLQRFNLLELFLPFHAAYLNQQVGETYRSSSMLMKLFFNLDTLVSCNQPCDCSLWVGLLAFHLALVTNPQDAFVVWVFASVLYHGKWKEGVKFARENAKLQVKFVPEISGFSEFKTDKELAKEASHLAALVRDSVGTLIDTDILVRSMSKYPVSPSSGLVFVPKKTGNHVAQLFDVLLNDVESYESGRENFMIDYFQLGKGNQHETRFVLGKVILETLSSGLIKVGMEVGREVPEVIDEKHDPIPSDLEKYQTEMRKDKKRKNEVDLEDKSQEVPKKRQKAGETSQLPEGELNKMQENLLEKKKHQLQCQAKNDKRSGTVQKKSHDMARKHMKVINKVKHHQLHDDESKQLNVSGSSNLSNAEKMKWEEKKDCHVLLQELVKEKTEKLSKILVERKHGQPSLSSLFRR